MDIADLAQRIERSLEHDLLRGWWPSSIDLNGGFHQEYSRDWSLGADRTRFIVHQARHLWSAATLAEAWPHTGQDYVAIARHGLRYLLDVLRDPLTGSYPWMIAREPLAVAPDGGELRRTYGQAFALYGLSAAARVLKDAEALAAAQQLFGWLEEFAKDPVYAGYREMLDVYGEEIRPLEGRPPRKTHNTSLHLLEAFIELHRVWPDRRVRQRMDELAHLLSTEFIRPEGCSAEALSESLEPLGDSCSFGHDLEAVHLLIAWAELTDSPIPEAATTMTLFGARYGVDPENGGMHHVATVDGCVLDHRKVWWVQAECLLGLAEASRALGIPAWHHVIHLWEWIEHRQIDPLHPGWFGTLDAFGGVLDHGIKGQNWKAMYHETRALLGTARALRTLNPG